jgi:hypothetical protein
VQLFGASKTLNVFIFLTSTITFLTYYSLSTFIDLKILEREYIDVVLAIV